jgi:hypothetical protein
MLQTNLEENIKIYIIFNDVFENLVFDKTVCKNTVEPDRPQMKIWFMGIPCAKTKATITH